jgi:hypothetical protein
MKPENKTFAIIAGYCAILWATNWSLSHDYAREHGLTASSIDMRNLGALVGLVASYVLARRIWRVSRIIFNTRVGIPKSVRLWGSWSYLLLLLPLGFGVTNHSAGTAEDGTNVTTIFEYGGSWAAAFFSAIAIMLFQLLVNLEAFNPENKEAEQVADGDAEEAV